MTETRSQEQKKTEESLRQLRDNNERLSRQIKELDDRVARQLKENEDRLSRQLKETDARLTKAIDQLTRIISTLVSRNESHPNDEPPLPRSEGSGTHQGIPQFQTNLVQTRYARIDFPHFSGEDPTGWIYKCEWFFEFNHIEEASKVRLAAMHLDDRAIQWFQWFEKTQPNLTWSALKSGL